MQLSVYVSHFVGGMHISREMHSEAFVSGRLDGVAFEETRLLLMEELHTDSIGWGQRGHI
jgi:hypothetical protein